MCKWSTIYYTSRKIENHSKVKSCYEVNVRAVMAMREIGRGHNSIRKALWIFKFTRTSTYNYSQ